MKIGIIGTGNIGSCLATLSIGNGFGTILVGRSEESREKAKKNIDKNFDDLIEAHKITPYQKEVAINKLDIQGDYGVLQTADFIFEAVSEDLHIKQETYEKLELVISRECIIASTTSSYTANSLAEKAIYKERMLVAHPFQPAHLLPLVEVVGNDKTENTVIQKTKTMLEKMQRQVVVLKKDIPGFIVNRLAQAMFRESIYMLEEGVTTAEDIDKAVRYAVGMRYASIGLLEYFDDVGFALEKVIASSVYPSLCNMDRVQDLVESGLKSGNTGRLSGKGMYDWIEKEDYATRKIKPYLECFNWNLPV